MIYASTVFLLLDDILLREYLLAEFLRVDAEALNGQSVGHVEIVVQTPTGQGHKVVGQVVLVIHRLRA